MASFDPPEMKSHDGVNLPGITISSPCFLAETSRIAIVEHGSISIGKGLGLGEYSNILTYGGNIRLGNNVSIQPGCMIYGHGGLTIGHNVSIATQTIIVPSNHNFEDRDVPIKLQGNRGKGIIIGDDVWIGAGCRILDGVTIGDGCVIGAGSVVTRSIPENCIAAGVPAKVLKKRKESNIAKKKIIAGQTPLFLLVVSSFREVDWILSALFKFKQKNPEYELVTLFESQDIYNLFSKNKFLFRQFHKLSSISFVPEEIDRFFSEVPGQVKMVLKDFGPDDSVPFKNILSQKCPNALMVNFPNSNHIHSNKNRQAMQNCKFPDAYSKHDIFLVGSEYDIPFWSQYVNAKKIKTYGCPKYDSCWVKEILDDFEFVKSEDYRYSRAAKTVFLFIYERPDPQHPKQIDYETLFRSFLDVVGNFKDALLFIKIHPGQNTQEIVNVLNDYKPIPWIISERHLLQLSHISDVVISGYSSGIMDSLAVNKPVIEFQGFYKTDPESMKKQDGLYSSIYQELQLSAPAQTKEDLHKMIESALNDPQKGAWKARQKAFKSICKPTDSASKNIAECLTDML